MLKLPGSPDEQRQVGIVGMVNGGYGPAGIRVGYINCLFIMVLSLS